MKSIAAVILAAGASTRFGQCKQLLDWKGRPLVAHVTDVALEARLEPVVVVVGCAAQDVNSALDGRPARVVMNWRWAEGMSASVQIGLAALPPETEAAIFLQSDQPLVTPALIRAMVNRMQESSASIVHPAHAGRRGTPVLFARRHFPELAAVSGDQGGRGLIERHAGEVATVEVDDPHVLADIDTPNDYERLLTSTSTLTSASTSTSTSASTSNLNLRTLLREICHLIIDMDGVLWRGDEPMPGLQDFFALLRRRQIDFILATNNSSKTPEQYVDKLARFGVEVGAEQVLTSALVSAEYLAGVALDGARVYVIGGDGIRRALEERGFLLVDEGADYVVVGWDQQLTWDELAIATLLIHEGADFLGTNPDVTFPTKRGPVPGNGAILAAIEAATGVTPVVTGKPEPQMYEAALRRMDASPEDTAMLGDRLDTDIAGAARVGLKTVLVLSGIATEEDVAASAIKPDLVCASISDWFNLQD